MPRHTSCSGCVPLRALLLAISLLASSSRTSSGGPICLSKACDPSSSVLPFSLDFRTPPEDECGTLLVTVLRCSSHRYQGSPQGHNQSLTCDRFAQKSHLMRMSRSSSWKCFNVLDSTSLHLGQLMNVAVARSTVLWVCPGVTSKMEGRVFGVSLGSQSALPFNFS